MHSAIDCQLTTTKCSVESKLTVNDNYANNPTDDKRRFIITMDKGDDGNGLIGRL